MKKTLLILIFTLISITAFSKSYDFYGLYGQSEAVVKAEFDEFGKVMGSAMNSGLGNLMNFDFIKVSLGGMFMPIEKTGVMKNSGDDYLLSQSTTLGISFFGFNTFARFVTLPTDGNFIAGGGIGYQISILPILTVTPFITYHQGINFESINNLTSYAFHVQAKGNFEAVNPYISLGVSYNQYDTLILLNNSTYFTYSNFLFHASVGVRVMFLYYEFTLSPKTAHAMGITIDF